MAAPVEATGGCWCDGLPERPGSRASGVRGPVCGPPASVPRLLGSYVEIADPSSFVALVNALQMRRLWQPLDCQG